MDKTPIPKRLYSVRDSSGYLCLGIHGVRKLIWDGKVPVVKIGRKMFIDIQDLETFVSKNKVVFNG
jgi:hypothetical protein